MSSVKISTGFKSSFKQYTIGTPFGIRRCWIDSSGMSSITLTSDLIVFACATTRTRFPLRITGDITCVAWFFQRISEECGLASRTSFQYPYARTSHDFSDSADGQCSINGNSKCFNVSSCILLVGLLLRTQTSSPSKCLLSNLTLPFRVRWFTILIRIGSFREGGVSVYDRLQRTNCSSPNRSVKYWQCFKWPWSSP